MEIDTYSEGQTLFFQSIAPLGALLISAILFRFCDRYWHVDAERAHFVLKTASFQLKRTLLFALSIYLFIWIGHFEQLFGVLPLLTGNPNWTFSALLILFIAWLVTRLRLANDRFIWTAFGISAAIGLLSYMANLPEIFHLLWLLSLLLWYLPVAFCGLSLLPARPVQVSLALGWLKDLHGRGPQISPLSLVYEWVYAQISVSVEPPIWYGFQPLPVEAFETGHGMISGLPSTGKSVFFRLAEQTILPRILPGSNQRALIFDAKRDAVSILTGMGLSHMVKILNPFDERCVYWDLAEDFKTPSDALRLSKLFLPDNPNDRDPFWAKSSQGVLADIILAHMLAVRDKTLPDWTLSDIIRSLQSLRHMKEALGLHARTKDSFQNFKDEKVLNGIVSTLDVVRREFEVLGALLDKPSEDPTRRFSLTKWAKGEGILVLSPSLTQEEVIAPFNRMVVDWIGRILLDGPEAKATTARPRSRTWFILDEVQRMGRIPGFENLLTNGRSKGLIAILGFQDYSDLRSAQLYGKEGADTITGVCEHQIYLQASEAHAKWCSQSVGSREVIQLAWSYSFGTSVSFGKEGTTTSRSYQTTVSASEKLKALFLPEEFQNLGKPGIRTPVKRVPRWVLEFGHLPVLRNITKFFTVSTFTPFRGIARIQGKVYRAEMPFWLTIESLAPEEGENLILRDDSEQFLRQWNLNVEPELSSREDNKAHLWNIKPLTERQRGTEK